MMAALVLGASAGCTQPPSSNTRRAWLDRAPANPGSCLAGNLLFNNRSGKIGRKQAAHA